MNEAVDCGTHSTENAVNSVSGDVASVRREGDGESNRRFDAGDDAARFGKLFESMWHVLHYGSDSDGRDTHRDVKTEDTGASGCGERIGGDRRRA